MDFRTVIELIVYVVAFAAVLAAVGALIAYFMV